MQNSKAGACAGGAAEEGIAVPGMVAHAPEPCRFNEPLELEVVVEGPDYLPRSDTPVEYEYSIYEKNYGDTHLLLVSDTAEYVPDTPVLEKQVELAEI